MAWQDGAVVVWGSRCGGGTNAESIAVVVESGSGTGGRQLRLTRGLGWSASWGKRKENGSDAPFGWAGLQGWGDWAAGHAAWAYGSRSRQRSATGFAREKEMGRNTLGVCYQLSNGFELKHDMLSGDEGVKIKSTRVSSNLNLGNPPLLAYWPF